MVERLFPTEGDLEALTALWEASVRATHDFLAPQDILFFRQIIRREALPCAALYVIRDAADGFDAFAGVAEDKLEMLFAAPHMRGKGLGRQLVEYLLDRCRIRHVDVNEQNTQALGFYIRMGFRITGRTAADPWGKSYPLLHLTHSG